jgi:phosphonate transport system substrate-binding protein
MKKLGKILFYTLSFVLLTACAVSVNPATENTPGLDSAMETAIAVAAGTAESLRPSPTPAPVGTIENPLILALPPGSSSEEARVEAGKAFAEQLSEVTGYTFVVVSPDSYTKLVQALGDGNAHVAVLTPYAYALAYRQGSANAAFARLNAGEKAYGAQFIARADAGFKSYFDAYTAENTADAVSALSQFKDKKPCWPDEMSLSGFAVPAGILVHNGIPLREAAIVQGQPTVVRAVYLGGICDFGATYIDARSFPALLDEYPDVLDEVSIIWSIPPIIPYEIMVIARNLPPQITLSISDALFRITGMQAGRLVLGQAYGIDEWERISDTFYEEFRTYIDASHVDLEGSLDQQP